MLRTKELSLGSMGCALSFLFLLTASFVPTGKLVMGFLASFVPCVLCIECKSVKTALISGIASAILAGFMLPKTGLGGVIIVLYCMCMCYYPSLKAVIEKKHDLKTEWLIKEIYFIVLSVAVKLITRELGIDVFSIAAGVLALTAYDILLSYVIGYYVKVISPRIQKSR